MLYTLTIHSDHLKELIQNHHIIPDSRYQGLDLVEQAIIHNDRNLLQILIDQGFDPNYVGLACSRHNYDLVQFLLVHGADANAMYKDSYPLIEALEQRQFGMVPLLLQYGADVNIQKGEPIIQIILLKQEALLNLCGPKITSETRSEIIKWLITNYDYCNLSLFKLLFPPDLINITDLMNITNHKNQTLLQVCTKHHKHTLVSWLLERSKASDPVHS